MVMRLTDSSRRWNRDLIETVPVFREPTVNGAEKNARPRKAEKCRSPSISAEVTEYLGNYPFADADRPIVKNQVHRLEAGLFFHTGEPFLKFFRMT